MGGGDFPAQDLKWSVRDYNELIRAYDSTLLLVRTILLKFDRRGGGS
jgi:hypothetical protein